MKRLGWRARVIDGRLVINPAVAIAPFSRGDIDRERGTLEALAQIDGEAGARRLLLELQAIGGAGELPSVECPLQHSLIDGVYVRTIFIPAGTVIVGKIHKHSHANILSQGEVIVLTEGGGREYLKGPLTMTSPAGCKRAVRTITDTTWTTIHRTDETDLSKIEDWVIAKSYEDYERFKLEGESMKQIEVAP
jgi:hypothetical protein